MTTTYTTKATQYPGKAALDSEFLAAATPEQVALFHRTNGTWSDTDARQGTWSLFDGTRDVLWFHRSTGEVEVAKVACIVDFDHDGVTLWDCPCHECELIRLHDAWLNDID